MDSKTMDYFKHETAIVDEGAQIGEGSKIWHFSHVMGTAKIGKGCNLGQNVYIDAQVIIGDGVKIQNNVSVYQGVEVGDDCFLGPSRVFTNVTNPRSEVVRRDEYKKTKLGKGVTIGANATVVCGVVLGDYVFVGAGAVVTKDYPAYALVVGCPAVQKGWMSAYGEKLVFDEQGLAKCVNSGSIYRLENGKVEKL